MSTPSPLENLPAQLTTFVSNITVAGRLVTSASVDRWTLPPGHAEINYLTTARITLRLYFAKSGTTTIFFIFHKDTGTWVMLDALVSLALRAASMVEPAPILTTNDIRRLIKVPSFLWMNVTENEVASFGPPETTRQNTVFFRIGEGGQDVLAIKNPEAGKKATLRYSPGGVPGQVEPKNGKYSLRPFMDLTRTLRDWLAQEKPAFLTLENIGPPADDTTVHRILTKLLQAYVDSSNALVPTDAADDTPLPLQQSYRIPSYDVTLKLRLKADGTLAQKEKEEQFQLAADVTLSADAIPSAMVTLGPPDFLVSGPLYDAFFSELQTPAAVEAIADAMHINAGFLRPFFASARPASAIFRVNRGPDNDRDILVLPGQLFGEPTTVIIEAEFRVNAKKEPPTVELQNAALQVITLKGGDPGSVQINFDYVEYFLLLARTIWFWVGALGQW
jgi:hypothetical protein